MAFGVFCVASCGSLWLFLAYCEDLRFSNSGRRYILMSTLYFYVEVIFLCRRYIFMSPLYFYVDVMFLCRRYIFMSTLCFYVNIIFLCRSYIFMSTLCAFFIGRKILDVLEGKMKETRNNN